MKSDIGFLQTELPSGKISSSSDRLNWLILLCVMIFLILFWAYTEKEPKYELIIILAAMAYAPKSIAKIAEMKYSIKNEADKPPES